MYVCTMYLCMYVCIVLTAIYSFYRLVAIVRGFVSLVHELFFTFGFRSMFLFTLLLDTKCYRYIMLLSKRVMSPESCCLQYWKNW